MNTWNPRQEIISAAHRWYWIAASFLLGAFLGWMLSLIWPAPYRATLDLYVGLNANRATRDLYIAQVAQEYFENLDDYKHWQMSQLNSLVMSDEYLAETLIRLQMDDPEWQNYDITALREVLSVAWRNTGDWHFSAQIGNLLQAKQAVSVWNQVVIEKTTAAVDAARQMAVIDSQLSELSRSWIELENRQILLQEINVLLGGWMNYFVTESPDTVLSPAEHWTLLSQVATAAAWNLGWVPTLEAAPPLGSSLAEYQAWLIPVIALIEAELAVLPSQIEALAADHASLAAEYTVLADASQALSANLEVQQIVDQPPTVEHLRPTGTLMLVGGVLGLLVWGVFWLVQITRKTER